MDLCYIDESGDLGALPAHAFTKANHQPVFVVAGIFIHGDCLVDLTYDFLAVKKRFYPGLHYASEDFLDSILAEVKGADVRKNALRGRRRARRHAYGFIDRILDLFKKYDIRFTGRVWVKMPGDIFNGSTVYSSSLKSIYRSFDHYLAQKGTQGVCIADSRNQIKNTRVSHSIFRQKFKKPELFYPKVMELPLFSHSNNHTGIQLCDFLCSALLFPLASYVYCRGFVENVHVQPSAQEMRRRWGETLRKLQYSFTDETGCKVPGVIVTDSSMNSLSSFDLFC